MYLKEIKASGFKSFADKISIELTSGISGVVGPNGSGKSNIVDAIRWVLGEQSVKNLRGDGAMSDVIFSGSKSRRKANYASVTLVFDNSDKYLKIDYDLVSIKRTIYRTGENEYFINNEKCRLKDILELLMDTGASKESYNIISQGDIGNILSEKPEDRRVIFEDASGVLKYKKRKIEALKKLDKTNENLARVNDIIEELKTTIEPLKEQSIKAKKYKENKTELENTEIALIVSDIENYNFKYKEAKEKVEELTDLLTSTLSSNSKNQALVEEIKLKINNLNNDLFKAQSDLVKISSKCEKLQGEKNLISERNKYNSDDVKLHDNILSLKEKISEIDKEISIVNKEINNQNEKDKLDKLNLSDIEKKISKVSNDKQKLEKSLNEEVRNLTELKHKKDVLNNSIENNSLLPFGVKNVLNNPKLIGIHNIVGNIIQYDEKYVKAIEVALGTSISYIICDNENNAKDAIKYLNTNNLGRATFYPINIIKPRTIDEKSYNLIKDKDNFIDMASNILKYDVKYRNIILNLLGNTIIVKDLECANSISKLVNHRYKIVTLDGDVVNVGGSLTGGKNKRSNSILNEKYELEETIKLIDKTNRKINELENISNEIDLKYDNLENKKSSLIITINSNYELKIVKEKRISDLTLRKEMLDKELESNNNIINNVLSKEEEKVIDDYYKALEEKETKELEIEKIKSTIENVKEELTNNESLLKSNNSEYNKINNELKNNEIIVNRLDVKLDNLLNTLSNDYSITYERAKANYILEIEEDVAREIVTKLKSEIKSLGQVNLGSIEEYERIKTRYEFLTNQRDDLINAQNMLLSIIDEMDEIMKEKFIASFKRVQEEFNNVFKELFKGGRAELKLTDPNDILKTGIEIIALPPGKKLTSISLLSGGEKTLTAISLLFAILRTRPVPFCVLDEVEAALDEVNVDTFGKYLKNVKDKTQFIVITHKKKTMEYADILYGITMQESGVSKLVSVKLEDIKE